MNYKNNIIKRQWGLWGSYFAKYIVLLIMAALSFAQFELSTNKGIISNIASMSSKYIVLSIFTLYAILLCVSLLPRFSWLVCLILNIGASAISIINYWTIKYHGMPVVVSDIKNIKTVLNVIDSYEFTFDKCMREILICCLGQLILVFLYKWLEKIISTHIDRHGVIFVGQISVILIFIVSVMYKGYLSETSIKPPKTIGWSWEEAYYQYGYIPCTIEAFLSSINVVHKPEGYSRTKAQELFNLVMTRDLDSSEYPDIILVLNESFYDLGKVAEISTDVPYMDSINSLNASIGYAVVPTEGGGTNRSEYELLTSNSNQLMQGITPFNQLDMNGAYSVVSELKNRGYYTIGAHSEPALNYSRIRGYPGLGFEETYFDGDFTNCRYDHDRWFETDECLYENIEVWYENALHYDKPIFLYLLTIQNHGGWDLNSSEFDSVHTLNDYGNYTNIVNEYLSSIKLTDTAFKSLVDYYSKLDRHVIIIMVGDHCPYFISEIIPKDIQKSEEYMLNVRSTPLIVWNNYGLDFGEIGTISINYLMPTVLEKAGIPVSNYYQYINSVC